MYQKSPVMQYPLGALEASSWCSPANPQTGCKAISGICKPMDAATLDVYKTIQRSLNRLLAKDGKALLDVDGRIGPKTVSAVNGYMQQSHASCDSVAKEADAISGALGALAMAKGAPAVADPAKSLDVASYVDPATNKVVHPEVKAGGFFGMPWWLVIAMAGAGYYIYTTTGPAKKKRAARKAKKAAKSKGAKR
jgi:hypothetical protein